MIGVPPLLDCRSVLTGQRVTDLLMVEAGDKIIRHHVSYEYFVFSVLVSDTERIIDVRVDFSALWIQTDLYSSGQM